MASGRKSSAWRMGVTNLLVPGRKAFLDSSLEISFRRALHFGRPRAAMPFRVVPVLTPSAARSRIWSPMATPPRGDSLEFLLRKIPNGRFWIGKSVFGSFADSTQLFRSGLCVASTLEPVPHLVVFLLQLACAHGELRRSEDVARLPHEGQGIFNFPG